MRKARTTRFALLLCAITLLIASCVQPSAEQDAPDPDGGITTRTHLEPATIDPQVASFVWEIAHIGMVFEPLLTFDPQTLRPVPAAAISLPAVSADGLTYTFRLRDGLAYSDGAPVSARDFAYGFSRLCDPTVDAPYASSVYIVAGCRDWRRLDPKRESPANLKAARDGLFDAGVKVLGDKEIRFTLTQPAPYFVSIAALWFMVPARESDVLRGGEQWTEPATYIGNGPFVLSEWKHGERLVFTRNDRYRMPPKLKRWTKVVIRDPEVAFAAYRNNELDVLHLRSEDLDAVGKDADLAKEVIDVGGSCTHYIGFNTRRAPFDDPKVRLAFAKAVDRDAFVRDLEKRHKAANGGFIPPGLPGHDPDDTAQRFDPAAARKLLGESRYAAREELRTVKFPYNLRHPDVTGRRARLEWWQQQWKANLGIEVALDGMERDAYRQLFRRPETSLQLVAPVGWCADYPDQQDWLSILFDSESTQESARWTGYGNEAFDRLVRAADRELDPKRRDELYLQASRLLSADAPAIWLTYDATKYLRKPWVRGVTDSVMDWIPGMFRLPEIYVTKRR